MHIGSWLSTRLTLFVEHVLIPLLMPLVARNWLPDWLLRCGVRAVCAARLADCAAGAADAAAETATTRAFVADLRGRPIAVATRDANAQHYEVPPEFFRHVMGDNMKYSATMWPRPRMSLTESEEFALKLVVERADVRADHAVLDLGCGWGSASLYIASRFPRARVTAVSNSGVQRAYIEAAARARGIGNVRALTADVNVFEPGEAFDRVISVEMFEHMKNYEAGVWPAAPYTRSRGCSQALLSKIARWLKPDGKLFVHIFAHRRFAYHYEDGWMARTFFSGGTMPSRDLLLHFQRHLCVCGQWWIDGREYARTCEAWLANLDAHSVAVMPIMEQTYGRGRGLEWFVNWRLFFIACAELFAYGRGQEWGVTHLLFEHHPVREGGAARE